MRFYRESSLNLKKKRKRKLMWENVNFEKLMW